MEKTLHTLPQPRSGHKRCEREKTIVNNSMSVPEYFLWNIIGCVLYYFSFMNRNFVPLNGKSELSSRIILTIIVAAWFAAGLALTFRARRTIPSVAGKFCRPICCILL